MTLNIWFFLDLFTHFRFQMYLSLYSDIMAWRPLCLRGGKINVESAEEGKPTLVLSSMKPSSPFIFVSGGLISVWLGRVLFSIHLFLNFIQERRKKSWAGKYKMVSSYCEEYGSWNPLVKDFMFQFGSQLVSPIKI